MYLLIGIWGTSHEVPAAGPFRLAWKRFAVGDKRYAAMKLTLVLLVGSAAILVAILALYGRAGTFDMNEMEAAPLSRQQQIVFFPLLWLGFGALAGVFPFHTWSPDGHASAPTAVSMLHAGVLMKLGAFGVMRVGMVLMPEGARLWAPVVGAVAAINILYGAYCAMSQTDLKYIVAYSSVSHMGVVMLGAATLTTEGWNGAVFQMVAHGIMTGLFFSLVGLVYERAHTRAIAKMGGFASVMPGVAAFFTLACLSSLGLPGTAGFVSEFTVFLAAWKSGHLLWAIPGVLGAFVTAVYVLRATRAIFWGKGPSSDFHGLTDAKRSEWLAPVLLGACLVVFGLWPRLLLDTIDTGSATYLPRQPPLRSRASHERPPDPLAPSGGGHARAHRAPRRCDDAAEGAPSRVLGFVVAGGLAGIFGASFFVHADGTAAHGAYQASAWTIFLQRVFLAAGALAALGGVDDVAQRTPKRSGEYWLMLLSSLVGMSLLAGARNLVLVVVGFELMGLPLYVLAAYAKNEEKKSLASEAAIKLYLVGATSSAITLFGLALLVGMSGTTRLSELAAAEMSPLASVGAVLVLAGVGYKIGMVPFHMWVPDTYQGARAPFVAFLSVAPKVAGVAVLAQIFLLGLGTHPSAWRPALAVLAFASMAVGNVLALMQTDLRRLLGYSGIAQMGYVLVAVAANDAESTGMTLFFLAAYTFTNMGAFLVVHAASDGTYEVASLRRSLQALAAPRRSAPRLPALPRRHPLRHRLLGQALRLPGRVARGDGAAGRRRHRPRRARALLLSARPAGRVHGGGRSVAGGRGGAGDGHSGGYAAAPRGRGVRARRGGVRAVARTARGQRPRRFARALVAARRVMTRGWASTSWRVASASESTSTSAGVMPKS